MAKEDIVRLWDTILKLEKFVEDLNLRQNQLYIDMETRMTAVESKHPSPDHTSQIDALTEAVANLHKAVKEQMNEINVCRQEIVKLKDKVTKLTFDKEATERVICEKRREFDEKFEKMKEITKEDVEEIFSKIKKEAKKDDTTTPKPTT